MQNLYQQISIGDMRQTGTLQQNHPVANASGGTQDVYVDVLTCRGRLRKQRGNKSLEQGELVMNKGYEWIVRYQAGIVVNTDTVWNIGGQVYRINDWEKIDEIPHFYRFNISLFQ